MSEVAVDGKNVGEIKDGIVSVMRTVMVSRQYKENSVLLHEEEGEPDEMIEVTYPVGVPLASVSCTGRLTINMGNFEFVVLGVSLTLPCVVSEIESAYETAKNFVDTRLSKEACGVREYKDRAKKESSNGS